MVFTGTIKPNELESENKINEEDINIDLIQKKLEEQGEVNNLENDFFSNKLDTLLENIAKIIASEKSKEMTFLRYFSKAI